MMLYRAQIITHHEGGNPTVREGAESDGAPSLTVGFLPLSRIPEHGKEVTGSAG